MTVDEELERTWQDIRKSSTVPKSKIGIYVLEGSNYETFKERIEPTVLSYHKSVENKSDWNLEPLKLDQPRSVRMRLARNIKPFRFPAAMSREERVALEEHVLKGISTLSCGGKYYSLTPGSPHFINEETYKGIADKGQVFQDMREDPYIMAGGLGDDWPYGRGFFISDDESLCIWIGEEDHLRITVTMVTDDLNLVFDRLKEALDEVSLEYWYGEWGYLTSCPTNLGTGMRASVIVKFEPKYKEFSRGLKGEHSSIEEFCEISPKERLGITESDIVRKLYHLVMC